MVRRLKIWVSEYSVRSKHFLSPWLQMCHWPSLRDRSWNILITFPKPDSSERTWECKTGPLVVWQHVNTKSSQLEAWDLELQVFQKYHGKNWIAWFSLSRFILMFLKSAYLKLAINFVSLRNQAAQVNTINDVCKNVEQEKGK